MMDLLQKPALWKALGGGGEARICTGLHPSEMSLQQQLAWIGLGVRLRVSKAPMQFLDKQVCGLVSIPIT